MSKRYGSFEYVLGPLLYGKSVGTAKLLAGMTQWPFRPVALTCSGKTDGGGAQVHAVLSVLSFCKAFGYTYLHTPFQRMEHTSEPSEVMEWETLFNLGEGELPVENCGYPIVPASIYAKSRHLWFQKVAVAVEALHGFTDSNPAAYSNIKQSIRQKYRGIWPVRASDRLKVAVHIRRGDALAGQNHRYTANDSVLDRIKKVEQVCESFGRACNVIVHSQGQVQDFKEFEDQGYELCLNAPPLDTFNSLVYADILLIAKSSFSYVAGLLSDGIVIHEPFWHAPLPDWIDASEIEALAMRLS